MSIVRELTINPTYCADWGVQEAFRELIQNGEDQHAKNPESVFSIEYDDYEGFDGGSDNHYKWIRFVNQKAKLDMRTLLLGGSEKAGDEQTLGCFGEGYKIAALVLLRLGRTFKVINPAAGQIWVAEIKHSDVWDSDILTFTIDETEVSDAPLVIEVGNTCYKDYTKLDVWLDFEQEESWFEDNTINTEYGQIITDEAFKGYLYVNHLFVCKNSSAKFGYNFKPSVVKLDRDRKTLPEWKISWYTNKMIQEAFQRGELDLSVIQDCVYNESFDSDMLTDCKDIAKVVVDDFNKAHKSELAIPVETDSEYSLIQTLGGEPHMVKKNVHEALKELKEERVGKLKSAVSNGNETLKSLFMCWLVDYGKKIDEDARMNLDYLIRLMSNHDRVYNKKVAAIWGDGEYTFFAVLNMIDVKSKLYGVKVESRYSWESKSVEFKLMSEREISELRDEINEIAEDENGELIYTRYSESVSGSSSEDEAATAWEDIHNAAKGVEI